MFVLGGARSALLGALLALVPPTAAAPAAAQQLNNSVTAPTSPVAPEGNVSVAAPGNTVVATSPVVSPGDTTANTENVTRPPDAVNDDVYSEMFKILFAILVLAVVIESALALIFNWRPFLMRFDGRGVKSLVAFVVSWLAARGLGIDIIERLSEATTPRTDVKTSELGFVLTGLVLAGGSSGVNNLLRSFGFRQIGRKEEITPKPPKNEAWVAVCLLRDRAVGPVTVQVQRPTQSPRLIGTITGRRRPPRLFAWALTDSTRFPPVAGFRVNGGEQISLILSGKDESGVVVSETWGPYAIEAGAIIDFEVKL